MKKILVIDNYDSFTYNLVHYVEQLTNDPVDVFRNDQISLKEIDKYDKIILSPGPGIPDEAGISKELIKTYAPTKSILGVCLGHQAIAEVFGGKIYNLNRVYHGVATTVILTNKTDYIFKDIPKVFNAGRYHSWMVSRENLPKDLIVTSIDENGEIMSISHKNYDVKGVQFHPESVLTEYGLKIVENWLSNEYKPINELTSTLV
ncbi:MAG: aminodeoxychorismate/anthranilate synthase component II [Bacteroidales bacterium]|nr:aminodeoxychorismate/anthranilate synthase component II [Bacteroidales bacterium]